MVMVKRGSTAIGQAMLKAPYSNTVTLDGESGSVEHVHIIFGDILLYALVASSQVNY